MRSRPDRCRVSVLIALACLAPAARSADAPASAPIVTVPIGQAPTPVQVEAAASAVKADPALGYTGSTTRSLRLKPTPTKRDKPEPPSPAFEGLAAWLADATRAAAWILGAIGLALVLVLWRRWSQVHGAATPDGALAAPSHVRDLDIRPDSLPDDIGAAARALWLKGEQRGALSLLYRGCLSRLVHVHGVPIGAASTEGDCVWMARRALAPTAGDYVARLVAQWQRAVYGGHAPSEATVLALCDEFAERLARSVPLGAPEPVAVA